MTAVKKVSWIGSIVIIIAVGGYGVYELITEKSLNASTLFYVFLGISLLFQSITWGGNGWKARKRKG